jgi:hypothetical protein
MVVFWDIVPCSLVNTDDWGTKLLWNVGKYLHDYMV